jgi:hypothetical protein
MFSSAQKENKKKLVGQLGAIRIIRFSSFERNEHNDQKFVSEMKRNICSDF